MTLYNKKFDITVTAIDVKTAQYIPNEGTSIPIKIDKIKGLTEHVYQCGFSDKKQNMVIQNLYIQIDEEIRYVNLCIKYTDEIYRVVPNAGFHLDQEEIDSLVWLAKSNTLMKEISLLLLDNLIDGLSSQVRHFV
jgi:hypothetical protein